VKEWAADYYDGRSTERRPVLARATPAGLELGSVVWPWQEIRQTQGFHRGELVRLERGEEAVTVADRAFLIEAHQYAPHIRQLTSDSTAVTKLALVIGSSLAVVAAVVLAFVFGFSWLVTRAVVLVPVAFEERLGEQVSRMLSPGGKTCDAVTAVTQALTVALPGNPYNFRVTVVDDTAVNALAAPGGYVIVYRGLLERTESADELAGVLAHEVQHVVERHSTRGLLRELGVAAAIGLIFGDASGIAGMAGRLGSLRFQRDDEDEADSKGIELMARAGFEPRAMITMFEKLERESGELPGMLEYISTHPAMRERMARLEVKARELRPAARAAVPSNWVEARSKCR
jgi:Zn-dependent protease with chaperone function